MKKKKVKIKLEDIIPEAFYDAVHYHDKKYKKEAVERGDKILNPFFFEDRIIISIDKIDKYNNIIYTEDNRYPRGTKGDSITPFLKIAFPYEDYVDFEKPYKRNDKLDNLLNN